MEFFPNGAFVRLQSRGTRKYVHADGDWERVSLRPLGPAQTQSLEAVWRVEHWVPNQGAIFVQLQNAAYGRYLSFSPLQAQPGHHGHSAVQSDRYEPPNNYLNAFTWRWTVETADRDYVRLRYAHANANFDLRANGRHRRWNTGVTVDVNQRPTLTTMMQWRVHLVPASPVPLPLPPPAAPPQPRILGRLRDLLFGNRGPGVHQQPGRMIRHVRAGYWPVFHTYDHSVFNLRTQLGQEQIDWNGDMLGFTLCIRPCSHGRLMPLVTDLPRNLDPINTIVLRTGSPAAAALVYPQIAAPVQ